MSLLLEKKEKSFCHLCNIKFRDGDVLATNERGTKVHFKCMMDEVAKGIDLKDIDFGEK